MGRKYALLVVAVALGCGRAAPNASSQTDAASAAPDASAPSDTPDATPTDPLDATLSDADASDATLPNAADAGSFDATDDVARVPFFRLAFSDSFDGPAVDSAKWIKSFPWGNRNKGNNEAQIYVDDAFEFDGGALRIRADKRPVGGFAFTSGILTSYSRFSLRYGRVVVTAKAPRGKALWPAVWLLPVSERWPPEIDVLEVLGQDTAKAYVSNHFSASDGRHAFRTGTVTAPDAGFADAFHTFAMTWTPGRISWSVDGDEKFVSVDGVPEEAMYLLVNLAVGGDWPGYPDPSTPFPSYFDIDRIEAYTFELVPVEAGADAADASAD